MDHVGHGSSQLLCVKLALDQATLALADLFVRKHASLGSGARAAVKDGALDPAAFSPKGVVSPRDSKV